MRNCVNCGSPLQDNEQRCVLCGTNVSSNMSSRQTDSNHNDVGELNGKSLDELKTLARSGDADAANIVGCYYVQNDDFVEADKWFELTYTGNTIHISGLTSSLLVKKILFRLVVDLSNGFVDYTEEMFNNTFNEYITPANIIVKLWKQDNKAVDAEYYHDARNFLSLKNLYWAGVLSFKDREDAEKAQKVYYTCTKDEFLDSLQKTLANLGYYYLDMILDNSKSSATSKAEKAYRYFKQNQRFINRNLDMAEELIVMHFGYAICIYTGSDVSDSFLPYIKNETLRKTFLKQLAELEKRDDSLLQQLDSCAKRLAQLDENVSRLRELNGKMFKSSAIKSEISSLKAANERIYDEIGPFLNTYIPEDLWSYTSISRIRDCIKGGYVNTLQEAISILMMEKQARHERYVDLAISAENWRRTHGN